MCKYNMEKFVKGVHQGDSFELIKNISDKSIDLTITDPPYGMSFQSNHRKVKHNKIINDDKFPVNFLNDLFRVTRKAVYVFCRWDNLVELPKPRSVIAWVKNNWSMGDLKHEHGRQWEAICFYPMEEHEFNKRIPDVIHANRTGNNLHPTEKPVELIRELIKCNKGDLVFDPFAGSGSTLLASKQEGRDFLGFEIEENYINIINKRLKQQVLTL